MVAVDPPASSGPRADACGIVAAGIDRDVQRLNPGGQRAEKSQGRAQLAQFAWADHGTVREPEEHQQVTIAEAALVHGPPLVVDKLEDVGPALKKATDMQMNEGKTCVIEIMCTRELGDPFRRDALAKPVRFLEKYKDYV